MTKRLYTETLAELRRLAEDATPGPWEWTTDLDVLLGGHEGEHCVIDTAMALRPRYVLRVASEDAELIAAAMNALPALLDAAEERDALLAVRPCDERHEEPYDFAYCETHDRTFALGSHCDHAGLSAWDYLDQLESQQRQRAIRAEEESDALRAEWDALAAMLSGRCLSDITHRDEEHRQSVCMLPEGHAPLMHDDCMGCTWTDADHWEPSAVDRVADEVARIADESQHEGWDSPRVRSIVDTIRRAIDGEPRP